MKTNKQNEVRIKEHNVKVLLDVLVSVLTEEQMDKVCQKIPASRYQPAQKSQRAHFHQTLIL